MKAINRFAASGAFLTLLLSSTAALAQTSGDTQSAPSPATAQPPASDQSAAAPAVGAPLAGGLETITVTAQRRSENLQRVPIAITAITSARQNAEGITETLDLPAAVPSLTLTPNAGNPTIYLRAVGSDQNSSGAESSIATYVDGVYMATVQSALFSFNNIERVEVLKGPQGTLFGRNATGGLIQVITRDPSTHDSLDASASYGSYDTWTGQFYGTVGLTDNVAANAAFYYSNQGNGWGTNIHDGSDAYVEKTWSGRLKQSVKFTNGGELVLSEDYTYLDGTRSGDRAPLPGAYGVGLTPYPGSFYDINIEGLTEQRYKGGGASAHLTTPVTSGIQAVNILAYRNNTFDNWLDTDGTPVTAVQAFQHVTNNYVTEEFQLQSAAQSKLKWIAGFFYLNMNDLLNPIHLTGTSQAANGGSSDTVSSTKTHSYAGFAQATYPITSSTNLTAGVRYSDDQKDFHGVTSTAAKGQTVNVTGSHSWGSWTYRVSLDQQLTDNAMVYIANSTGFKAGQFNALTPTSPPVNPEKLNSTEGGFKTQWLDNRLRFNASGFYYDYKDLQLSERLPTGLTQLLNAASAHIKGVDFSVEAQPVNGFSLHGDGTFLHARYKDFLNAPYLLPSPAVCTPTPHSTGAPTGGNTTCSFNASGNVMEHAPTFSGDAGATYAWAVGPGSMTVTGLYSYSTGAYFNPDNRLKQPAFGVLNGNIGYTLNKVSLSLWGRNLTNKKYYITLSESQGDQGIAAAPRELGVTLRVKLD